MAKLITDTHNAVEIYFESGSARIRLKERKILESMPEENLSNLRYSDKSTHNPRLEPISPI